MDTPAPKPMRTSPLAIASLLFGLVICCFGINGIIAIVLGALALLRIRRRPEELTGRGLAFSGIGLGALSVLFLLAFIGFFVHRYQQVTPAAEAATADIVAGDYGQARGRFVRSLREQAGFDETLVNIHNRYARLGTFEELETDWSVNISDEVTNIRYTARFSDGTIAVNCSFIEEDGEYRLTSYHPRW